MHGGIRVTKGGCTESLHASNGTASHLIDALETRFRDLPCKSIGWILAGGMGALRLFLLFL